MKGSADEAALGAEPLDGWAAPWRSIGRFAPAAALLLVFFLAWWAGLPQQLSLSHLGERQAALQALVAQAPALALLVYVVLFALLTAACLPVALVMTLVGGAVFGPAVGAVGTVFGATGAALLTYLAARSAFSRALAGRVRREPRLAKIMRGFGKDTFAYILTLRLIPMFPFALVNIAAGLAAVPVKPYAGATALGAVPTSLIYATLGAGLGRSLADDTSVLVAARSPSVILPLAGLALLSLAPILIKRLRRRAAP